MCTIESCCTHETCMPWTLISLKIAHVFANVFSPWIVFNWNPHKNDAM